ncbi:MAG TPA: hypothetical protein VL242_32130, partial [Sorangium sp.]|nr:hypothetical protein [Sorangium sp.]
ARINLWTFRLPGLRERVEDIEPNLDYELDASARLLGVRITMSRDARARFLRFATSREAVWPGNFRDFNAAVTRMATLAPGGRIGVEIVDEEIERLSEAWRRGTAGAGRGRGGERGWRSGGGERRGWGGPRGRGAWRAEGGGAGPSLGGLTRCWSATSYAVPTRSTANLARKASPNSEVR